MYSALSSFNTTTEVPLSKTPNPQLLPGRRSIGCPLLRACVHGVCVCIHFCVCAFGWVKCRAQIPSMGHHTWPHVLSFPFQPNLTTNVNKRVMVGQLSVINLNFSLYTTKLSYGSRRLGTQSMNNFMLILRCLLFFLEFYCSWLLFVKSFRTFFNIFYFCSIIKSHGFGAT